MSDYSNTFGGAAKDAANDTILGAQHDTQYDALATHSATKANKITSATNGNIISQDANGDLVDSGIVATDVSTLVTNAITTMTAQASTSGTSLDWTSIPSWVKRITIMFSGVSTSGTDDVVVRLGDAGGFETSGYTGAVGAVIFTTPSGVAEQTGYWPMAITTTAGQNYDGKMEICNLDGNTWVMSNVFGEGTAINWGTGSKTLTGVLTQVRVTTQSGTDTFDAGNINVMYE